MPGDRIQSPAHIMKKYISKSVFLLDVVVILMIKVYAKAMKKSCLINERFLKDK